MNNLKKLLQKNKQNILSLYEIIDSSDICKKMSQSVILYIFFIFKYKS